MWCCLLRCCVIWQCGPQPILTLGHGTWRVIRMCGSRARHLRRRLDHIHAAAVLCTRRVASAACASCDLLGLPQHHHRGRQRRAPNLPAHHGTAWHMCTHLAFPANSTPHLQHIAAVMQYSSTMQARRNATSQEGATTKHAARFTRVSRVSKSIDGLPVVLWTAGKSRTTA